MSELTLLIYVPFKAPTRVTVPPPPPDVVALIVIILLSDVPVLVKVTLVPGINFKLPWLLDN